MDMNLLERAKLDKPVIENYEGMEIKIDTFREYAQVMQYPDRTGIQMSRETENMAVGAINQNGLAIDDVYEALSRENGSIKYVFDDDGHENVKMAEPDKAREILDRMISQKDRTPITEKINNKKKERLAGTKGSDRHKESVKDIGSITR